MKNFSRIVRFAAVFSFFSLNAWAQFSGNIQGDVRDPSGAAVAGAVVTLNNAATNVNQTTNTDTAGNYRFVSLAPGDYKVSVSASGFAPAAVTVTLLTSQTVEVPVKLSLGSTTESVTVTTEAPILDTADSRTQLTIETRELTDLPLQGRL